MNWTTESVRQLLEQFLAFCSTTDAYTMRNIYTSTEDRRDLIDGFLASRAPSPETIERMLDLDRRLLEVERQISSRLTALAAAETDKDRDAIKGRIARLSFDRQQLQEERALLRVEAADER